MIVSGGQTGADRAALDVAMVIGIAHGGWCPQGRLAEDGMIPEQYRLQELPGSGYRQRTLRNVIDSDATLILNLGTLDGGSLLTWQFAGKQGRPCRVLSLDQGVGDREIRELSDWLCGQSGRVLNVAGPRESKRPGIYRLTHTLLLAVLRGLSTQ